MHISRLRRVAAIAAPLALISPSVAFAQAENLVTVSVGDPKPVLTENTDSNLVDTLERNLEEAVDNPSSVHETAPLNPVEAPEGFHNAFAPRSPMNNPECVPSPEHPNPVIFIHGTTANARMWDKAAQRLTDEGYCTWSFNYGMDDVSAVNLVGLYGISDLDQSTAEIARSVEYIMQVTGAEKVDLVGHSQGGLQIKKLINEYNMGDKVSRVVGLAPTYHGTTINSPDPEALRKLIETFPRLARFFTSTASIQQVVGSEIIERVNETPDTYPGIIYTNVYSAKDTTATPNSTSMLEPVEGADVVNMELSQQCGLSYGLSHPRVADDKAALGIISWALSRAKGDHAVSIEDCK